MTGIDDLVGQVQDAWGWTGIEAARVALQNDFGNLVVEDISGRFWRICPEELSCEIIASDPKHYDEVLSSAEFQDDFGMEPLLLAARRALGPLVDEKKYCLKLPPVLGGSYETDNISTISLNELIAYSGYIAQQIKNLPDDAAVELKVVE